LSFERVKDFDFNTALLSIDIRRDYGETRLVGVGYFDARLHVLCYIGTATGIRVISLRRTNAREVRRYEKAQTAHR
jgi:uncharacterized protein